MSNVINLSTYCIQYAQVQLFSPLTRRGGGGTISHGEVSSPATPVSLPLPNPMDIFNKKRRPELHHR